MRGGGLKLVLPAGNDVRVSLHQGVPAVARDLARIILFLLTDFGIHHVGPIEKFGFSRARHQRGDRDAFLILQLVAERVGEAVDEGFGAVVDRLETAWDEAGDRPR